jgi:hypothetical protein
MTDQPKAEKKNVGKAGKYCPFRPEHKCGSYCGLWMEGLKACVFHGINMNTGTIAKLLKGDEQNEKPRQV